MIILTLAWSTFKGNLDVSLAFIFPKFAFVIVFLSTRNSTDFLIAVLTMSWALTDWFIIDYFTSMILTGAWHWLTGRCKYKNVIYITQLIYRLCQHWPYLHAWYWVTGARHCLTGRYKKKTPYIAQIFCVHSLLHDIHIQTAQLKKKNYLKTDH